MIRSNRKRHLFRIQNAGTTGQTWLPERLNVQPLNPIRRLATDSSITRLGLKLNVDEQSIPPVRKRFTDSGKMLVATVGNTQY